MFIPSVISGSTVACKDLKFNNKLLGELVPCQNEKALGMLCRTTSDAIVYPNNHEVEKMKACGIKPPTKREATKKNNAILEQLALLKSGGKAFKSALDFDIQYEVLLDFVLKKAWSKSKDYKIQKSTEKLMQSWNMEKSEEDMQIFFTVADAVEFDKFGKNKSAIIFTLKESLIKNYTFLNVDEIISSIHICSRSYGSQYVRSRAFFDSTGGTGLNGSAFVTYYFKMFCIKSKQNVVAMTFAGFYKRATFEATKRKIEYQVEKTYTDHVIVTEKLPVVVDMVVDSKPLPFIHHGFKWVCYIKVRCNWYLFVKVCKKYRISVRVDHPHTEWRTIPIRKKELRMKEVKRVIDVEKKHLVNKTR